jgi:hypothetical protein
MLNVITLSVRGDRLEVDCAASQVPWEPLGMTLIWNGDETNLIGGFNVGAVTLFSSPMTVAQNKLVLVTGKF